MICQSNKKFYQHESQPGKFKFSTGTERSNTVLMAPCPGVAKYRKRLLMYPDQLEISAQ